MNGIGKTYLTVITTVGVALAVGRGGYEIGKDMADKVSDAEKHSLHESNLELTQRVRQLEDSIYELSQAGMLVQNGRREINGTTTIGAYNFIQQHIRFGTSFLDTKTNASISILAANSDNTGKAFITLPGKKPPKRPAPVEVSPGQQWAFEYDSKDYILILESVQWAAKEFSARVKEQ